jgi:sulfofructose kinase
MSSVLCIGSAVLDLIALIDEPLEQDQRISALDAMIGAGGLAATAAVAIARLGVPVSIVATIGDDEASRLIREGLEREGVGTATLRSVPGRPMMSSALVDRATGQRAIVSFRPDHAVPQIDAAVLRAAREAAWLHVDHLGMPAVAALREAGIATPVSLDHGVTTSGLELRDVSLYAPTEARLLERYPGRGLREAIAAALEEGPAIVAVTQGGAGSLAGYRPTLGADLSFVEMPAYHVDVRSTLGAGDVFHGALVAGLVRGLDVPHALRHANAAAALSCRALDGRSAIPTWPELEGFLASNPRGALS